MGKPKSQEHLRREVAILEMAQMLFNDAKIASQWMKCPVPAFGGITPEGLAAREDGVMIARSILLQIEHGIYN